MTIRILGISAYYHDSAAALLENGKILAAAQEERFSRKKHDPGFPKHAVAFCLKQAGIALEELDYIVFYDKPWLKFERLLETYLAYAPKGIRSFVTAMPVWIKEKLFLKNMIKKELAELAGVGVSELPQLLFSEHHMAHAASAFFPSPFQEAAVLCLDGVGEWATTSVWQGRDNQLIPQWEIDFPHSLGLLYSAFTYYTGFKVNSGEYKLMGLAPYGDPKYVDLITRHLVDIKEDGTFRLDMRYFNYAVGLTMTNARFHNLFGAPPRKPETPITKREMDIARSIQVVTEDIVLKLARTVKKELGTDHLCLAGGVALNCVANGKLLREGIFKEIWIQPASGDAGGALGAASLVWHQYLGKTRQVKSGVDQMQGTYLGPEFSEEQIRQWLKGSKLPFREVRDDDFFSLLAEILDQGNVLGWFQGKMEFGPRALGARSIIGDPRKTDMQSVMNLKIKYRESFRPFAPAVLAEKVSDWFDTDQPSPYMLLVSHVNEEKQVRPGADTETLFGIDRLKVVNSQIPAVTHVDYSARVQTVHRETNPAFHKLLEAFDRRTGCPVLVNTSFNVRGEPIVCSPEDAYRCFMRTEMDYLVLGRFILEKKAQPVWQESENWRETFELD